MNSISSRVEQIQQLSKGLEFLFGTGVAGVCVKCTNAHTLPVYWARHTQTAETIITGIHTMRRPGTLRPLLPPRLPHDNSGPLLWRLLAVLLLAPPPPEFQNLNIYETGTGSLQSEDTGWSILSLQHWQLSVLKAPSWALIYPPVRKCPMRASVCETRFLKTLPVSIIGKNVTSFDRCTWLSWSFWHQKSNMTPIFVQIMIFTASYFPVLQNHCKI